MPLAPQILEKLNTALLHRRVREGFLLLDKFSKDIARVDRSDPNAASLLLCMAQWVDVGYRDVVFLDSLIEKFSNVQRGSMPFGDYICLRIVEGYRVFASADAASAIPIFEFILQIETGVLDPYVRTLAYFWNARAHRKQGEYELAFRNITEAKSLASTLKISKLLAVMKIHESWMLFQRGQRKDAFRLLDEAEEELKTTGHDLSLGNIASARGRFVRRSGEYGKALDYFERAVEIYSDRFPNHPNLARVLVNAAYVKRLMALDLKGKSTSGRANGAHHGRYLEICRQALDLLQRAGEIYSYNHHQAGTGSVFVNSAYLHLDSGDIDQAEIEAEKAFLLGDETKDQILKARARTLQAAIQNEHADEEVGESPDIAMHANLARTYSEEAIDLAKLTQNKRLLAGAYITRSAIAASGFFQDWETAKQFATMAGDLLSRDDRDHLSRELGQLKARILRATGIDEMLRAWSEGIVSNKTFQQITEEFAEIVIPKVWMREGRKISRVAAQLSMSPKKVRRILSNTNLLKHSR
jgi:tetratricopeptide (TPR) repeat protein